MAESNTVPWCVWTTVILLWTWEAGCDTQHQAEEVELFHSDKQSRLEWTSDPPRQWTEVRLRVGTQSRVPVLQACGKSIRRTVMSQWMERKDAHHLLMDLSFTQEEEPSSQLGPLQVHLFDSNTPLPRFQYGWKVLDLQTSSPFPVTVTPNQISSHMNRSVALSLGPVSLRGFQLAFSYSGACVLLASIRLYYRRCPDIVAHLALFNGTGALSGPLMGSCVKGAVEVSPPVRECTVDGVWGPLQGDALVNPGDKS
ncbi:ephrin type-A receptor 5-like [Plectropomus leopardus]|uniref:ephrin type-A receptor 5-like n=1 Tax=Plectropomus leopardus TaxID=160734 RepID=UPI001C4D5F60|nr:ephrin type-A receptor 5-like [Plectropomus leopardus]